MARVVVLLAVAALAAELAADVLARDHTAAPWREGVPRPPDDSPRPWSVVYG